MDNPKSPKKEPEKRRIILPGEEKESDTEDRPSGSLLAGKAFPKNDAGLTAVEIIGRCSKCNALGSLEYPKNMIPPKDVDNILAYRPVKCRCAVCNENAEFVPIEVKKYPDVPMLGNIQKSFRKGQIR